MSKPKPFNLPFCILTLSLPRGSPLMSKIVWRLDRVKSISSPVGTYGTERVKLQKKAKTQAKPDSWETTTTEMPTSGDFSFITLQHRSTPPPPSKKKEMRLPPHQIVLHAPKSTWVPIFTWTLQREKGKKISWVFLELPKLTQSWSEDFSMLAQRIRKVS